jgi:hypothetical protein
MRYPTPTPNASIEKQPEAIIIRLALCGEARGEQDQGGTLEAVAMLGVLWVAENRRTDAKGRWRPTLRGVLLQRAQFSCFNPYDPNRDKLLDLWRSDPVTWERADTVADLFERGLTIDPTLGSTHYSTKAIWGRAGGPGPPFAWYSQAEIDAGRTVALALYGSHVFGRAA